MNNQFKSLANLDGLVIIHPDFTYISYDFQSKLENYVSQATAKSIPIFVVPSFSKAVMDFYFPDMASSWTVVSKKEYLAPEIILPAISKQSGKPISELNLAYGGMFYGLCMHSFALRTANNVINSERLFSDLRGFSASEKVNSAVIIPRISMHKTPFKNYL